jgi:peptidoglycan/xylan/chitin deacetylase (PgdA/CDA1 family)
MLCVTVDVEDFHEGMAVLGHPVPRVDAGRGDLEGLVDQLERAPSHPKITLFVVAEYVRRNSGVLGELAQLASSGHEVACHGLDHGRLPERGLVEWLAEGRKLLEDLLQTSVDGFRSPRFDVPAHGDLKRFREEIAEAGYHYVSDAHLLGGKSHVKELPVLSWLGVPLGGGSYQRVLPKWFVASAALRARQPAVFYYHSYDFDGTVPRARTVRSLAVARQVLLRERIPTVFANLVGRLGSATCSYALGGIDARTEG